MKSGFHRDLVQAESHDWFLVIIRTLSECQANRPILHYAFCGLHWVRKRKGLCVGSTLISLFHCHNNHILRK